LSTLFADLASERAILAGICRYHEKAYYDVVDIIQESSFNSDLNRYIYQSIKSIFNKQNNARLDIPTLQSAAQELGLGYLFAKKDDVQYLQALFEFPIDLDNVRKFAAKIRKLEIGKLLYSQLEDAQQTLSKINGSESVSSILSIAEEKIFNFSSLLNNKSEDTELLGEDAEQILQNLIDNPVTQVGIPTGLPAFDKMIGGGLREGSVSVISARIKQGKSMLADNIGRHIAENYCPVLNLDTEMLREDHLYRTLASMTEIPINDIETGSFAKNPHNKIKVQQAAKILSKTPYHHKNIRGLSFEDQLSIIRRWMAQYVGFNTDGTAKKCVIIYDYIKLMDTVDLGKNMAEHQLIGFMMTSMHNFATHYKVPFLAFCQQNRDGITKEDTGTASQSDRILWLCDNFSIFKTKSDEERSEDGSKSGNKKLIVLVSRHGGGCEFGNYINLHMNGCCGKITEGKTKFELELDKGNHLDEGFKTEGNDDDIPFDPD
jgi:replicative DNA helicase